MTMNPFDKETLNSIFEPVCIGVPPINAGYDLMMMPDGEIRHYSGDCGGRGPVGQKTYVSSKDNGLSWKTYPSPEGCPGAMLYVPFAKKWLLLQPSTQEGLAFYEAESMDGPFRKRIVRPGKTGCIRVPIILKKKKNRILTCGQETLPDRDIYLTTVFYTDDCGDTWKTVHFDPIPFYQQKDYDYGPRWNVCGTEPTVVELDDGTLYMLIRTPQDVYYESRSFDSGETWTTPAPSPFYGTATDPTLFKMKSGRLLFFGNLTRSMPEIDREHADYLDITEKMGRWEDLFTNRDVLHAALSDDDGKTWHGFREIWLNPMRNDSNMSHNGGQDDSLDRSVHQSQAVELPFGKLLLAFGQHKTMRKMIIFDPEWLLEKEREEDFVCGTEHLSTHLYLKSRLGSSRGAGAFRHCCWDRQQGAVMTFREEYGLKEMLHVARFADPRLYEERQGVVWNFPLGASGEVDIEFIPLSGMKGTLFMLMDHWANPGDPSAFRQASWTVQLAADGTISGEQVKFNEVNTLHLFWDGKCGASSLNVGAKKEIPLTVMPLNGINYLHVQSAAENEDTQGILLRHVKAVIR